MFRPAKTKGWQYVVAVLLILALLAVAGCGGGKGSQEQTGGQGQTGGTTPAAQESKFGPPVDPEKAKQTDAKLEEVLQKSLKAANAEIVNTSKFKKDPPYVIGFSNASVSNSWRVFMQQQLMYEAAVHKDLIKDLIITDANDDPNKQISDIQDLITRGVDILIISAATEKALNAAVDQAAAQGIPVVIVDRAVTTPNYTTFVGASSEEMGRIQAQWLADALKGQGNIVMLSGAAGSGPAEGRLRGAKAVFAKYPGIKILAHAYTDFSPAKGKSIMQNYLQSFPKIDGIWADSGLQGSGAVQAYLDAGKEIPPISGEDYNGFLKLWKQKGFKSVGVSYPTWMGAEAMYVALQILQGREVPKFVDTGLTVITQETLDKFVRLDQPDDFWADNLLPDNWLPK